MNNFKSILLLFFISISLLASSGFIYATQVDVFPITTSLTSFQSYLKSYSIQASDKSYIINTWEFEGLDSDEYKASLYLVSETTGAKGVLVSNIPTNIKRFDWEVSAFMKTTAHGPRDTEVLPGVYRMRLELTDTQGEIQ